MNDGSSVLKEINKNTSAEHFKVSKKHKFGHGGKKLEANVLCGKTLRLFAMSHYQMSILIFLALFESIENNQVETLKTLLEKDGGESHVNTLNNDGFLPLDIAVLIENHAMIKILLQHGATSGIESSESIETQLNLLLSSSEQKLSQLTSASSTSSAQSCAILDFDQEKSFYEKRIKVLRKMTIGWQNLRIPDSPFSFSVGS